MFTKHSSCSALIRGVGNNSYMYGVWSVKVQHLFKGDTYFSHCLPSYGVYLRAACIWGGVYSRKYYGTCITSNYCTVYLLNIWHLIIDFNCVLPKNWGKINYSTGKQKCWTIGGVCFQPCLCPFSSSKLLFMATTSTIPCGSHVLVTLSSLYTRRGTSTTTTQWQSMGMILFTLIHWYPCYTWVLG